MVTEALAETLESATDVATTAKVAGLGGCAAAVKMIAMPEGLVVAESVPHAPFWHCAPERAQLTT